MTALELLFWFQIQFVYLGKEMKTIWNGSRAFDEMSLFKIIFVSKKN